MLLVVGDRMVSQPPRPWPLLVADAWAMPVVATGAGTALQGWLASASWLRVPDVRAVVLAFGADDLETAPVDFAGAVAACAYNALARWPNAKVLVATPPCVDTSAGRRWHRRALPVLRARLRADGIEEIRLDHLFASDVLGISVVVSGAGMVSDPG